MTQAIWAMVAILLAFSSGCGGGHKRTPSPSTGQTKSGVSGRSKPHKSGAKATKTEPKPRGLPTQCVQSGDICYPPPEFVDRLCQRNYPDVAVYMMGPNQPWTHRFVRVGEAQAVNPISGRVGEVRLTFGEEIIMLRYKAGATEGAMQVSGTERYEILRWDGSCATLEEGEFVEKIPKQQLRYVAPIWKRLGDTYRAAFLENETVAAAEATRKTECKGVGLGRPPSCYKSIEDLNRIVAEVVHEGFALPLPEVLP